MRQLKPAAYLAIALAANLIHLFDTNTMTLTLAPRSLTPRPVRLCRVQTKTTLSPIRTALPCRTSLEIAKKSRVLAPLSQRRCPTETAAVVLS